MWRSFIKRSAHACHTCPETSALLHVSFPANRQLCRQLNSTELLTSRGIALPSHISAPAAADRHRHRSCIRARGAWVRCCASSSGIPKHRIVFLGTPEVAASVLQHLHEASTEDAATFQMTAVVTQPGRPRGRGNKAPQPSMVAQKAIALGFSEEHILSPVKANEGDFLKQLAGLQPDLCITAAYGNILPQRFLDIPRFGTLNIHPSLLPRYRGASPVQRALQDGVMETGVSVAFTVRAMDAGPILAQEHVAVDDAVQAPELLESLFRRGTELLIRHLPLVWDGRARQQAPPQDEAAASHASKIEKAEGQLDFREGARTLHNKVRAFAGWPGTAATFHLDATGSEAAKSMTVKITRTCVTSAAELEASRSAEEDARTEVCVARDRLWIPCRDGDCLELLELQPTGKKSMPAGAFINGLKGRRVFVEP